MDMNLNNRNLSFVNQLSVAVLLAWPILLHGDETTLLPSLAVTEVHIANKGNREISFNLRPDSGKWKTFKIQSGEDGTYTCDKCQKFDFVMRSEGGKEVKYVLEPRNRYLIKWDDAKERWDLFTRRSP